MYQPGVSHTFSSSSSLSHPLPWSTRNFRQSPAPRRLTLDLGKDPGGKIPEEVKNEINPKHQNSKLKSVNPQNYYPSTRYNPPLLQWPKSDLLMPKGISTVTEKRLLARAEALHQRNQTGISAAQSLPKINESIALQLHQNHLNSKRAPWARATASEPQSLSQNRGGNVRYRLAAKAPVHYNLRSSTAHDFAWYNNSRVSGIWK